MTRRSRGCQSSSRYGAYNRSFVSALTIAGDPGVSSTFDVRSSKIPHHVVCKKWRPCPPTNVDKCKGNIRGAPYWAGRMNHEPPLPWSAAACAQKEEILAIISMTRCCAYPHYQQNKRPGWVPGILMSSSEGASVNKGLIYQSGNRRRRRPPEQTLCKHKPPSLCARRRRRQRRRIHGAAIQYSPAMLNWLCRLTSPSSLFGSGGRLAARLLPALPRVLRLAIPRTLDRSTNLR